MPLPLFVLMFLRAREDLRDITHALDRSAPGAGRHLSDALARIPPTRLPSGASWLRRLVTLPTWLREARLRRAAVTQVAEFHPALAAVPPERADELAQLIARARRAAVAEVRAAMRA